MVYDRIGKGNVIDGVEFEALGQITPRWNLAAGYSHTRSRNASGQPINTIVPRNLLRVFTTYRFGDEERWTVGGKAGVFRRAGIDQSLRLIEQQLPSGAPIPVDRRPCRSPR